MLTAAEELGEWATALRDSEVPTVARERVRHFFLDYLAIAAHASVLDSSRPVRALAREVAGAGGATVLGRPDKVRPEWAALVNAMAAHSMELDDTYLPGSVHNESFVFSTALALAQDRGLSGRRLVEAVLVGWEVASRCAEALGPQATNARGFHPTGTCGALGAAAVAAHLLDLDAGGFATALGIAASQASGLLEFVTTGAWTKRFHAGWAAHAGIVAAMLARRGMTAPPTALEGSLGFLHAYSGSASPEVVVRDLGRGLAIERTALKYYPCNYYLQAVDDAVLQIAGTPGFDVSTVRSVEVEGVSASVPLAWEPLAAKRRPRLMIDAQFSGPFNVALGLVRGRVSFADLTPHWYAAPEVVEVMDRVTFRVAPDLDAQYPGAWPARVSVGLADGRDLVSEVRYAKGDPRNPLSEDEVRAWSGTRRCRRPPPELHPAVTRHFSYTTTLVGRCRHPVDCSSLHEWLHAMGFEATDSRLPPDPSVTGPRRVVHGVPSRPA